MRRYLTLSLGLLLASATVAAQSIDPAGNAKSLAPLLSKKSNAAPSLDLNAQAMKSLTVLQTVATNPACPFPISARQGSGAGLIAVRPGQPDEGPRPGVSQRIQLSVADSRSIAEASIVVHGTTAAGRMMPLGGSAGPSQISRPLNVTFSSAGKNQENADLRLRGFTSVSSIDVQSVTYADGTVWRSMAGACRVVPDPVMRIAAR